jgi:amidohydrolase
MDALNLVEKTSKPYASGNRGFAHGCGHDGHIVCVLEAARVLAARRDLLAGSVRLIFQPAEETGQGAQAMIEAGALGNPLPAAIFALHAWPGMECSIVASRPGPITAGNDLFSITVRGKGGHGARPHESRNSILSASRIALEISDLAELESRSRPSGVVSVGVLRGGEQPNVIPDEAFIQGTLRSTDEDVRRDLFGKIRTRVSAICGQDRVTADINFQTYCPPVHNHPDLYALFEKTADNLLGPEKRIYLIDQSMGSEDFGYYTRLVPGLLIRLGMGSACPPLHTSGFDFADESLEAGISILVGLVMQATEKDFRIRSST